VTDVENIRYELGKEARQKGESLHNEASEEFRRGWYRGRGGFGSNITPRKFGKGNTTTDTWECVCGYENVPSRKFVRAGRELCWQCGTERSYSDIDVLSIKEN
jgi:hypothetical protein